MIKVLCLEDSSVAADRMQDIIYECLVPKNVELVIVKTVREAKQCVRETVFDVAIIDVQVPLREGEQPKFDGGLLFLDHVLSSPHAHRPRYLVGVTAEKDLFEHAQQRFIGSLFTVLHRDESSTVWMSQLTRFLAYVAGVLDGDSATEDNQDSKPSLAIVCALADTELGAVLESVPCNWVPLNFPGDPTSYYSGILKARSGSHRLVAAAAQEPGMAVAACLTTKLIMRFAPRIVAMTGIAASIDREAGFGDILAADQTWDYTTGKITDAGILAESRSVKCDPMIVDQVRTLARDSDVIDSISQGWSGPRPRTALCLRIGPFASGGAVVEATDVIAAVKRRDRKTIGLDMEAHGVAAAAWYSAHPPTTALVVKSVVDYGVPPKTDEWHGYAAYTSARFLAEWARRYL